MSEMEKFFKALNEGRVILRAPSEQRFKSVDGTVPLAKFEDHNDAPYYSTGTRQIVVLDSTPGTDGDRLI